MYRRKTRSWEKHLDFILIDLASLIAAFWLAYMFRHGTRLIRSASIYRSMFFSLCAISLLVNVFGNGFSNVLRRGRIDELTATLRHVAIVCIIGIVYMYIAHTAGSFSRLTFTAIAALYTVFSYAGRIIWKRHLHKKMSSGGARSLLIVTVPQRLENMEREVVERNYEMYSFEGVALIHTGNDGSGSSAAGRIRIPVVADEDTLIDYLMSHPVDEVLFDLPGHGQDDKETDLVNTVLAMGITTHVRLEGLGNLNARYQSVSRIGNYMVYTAALRDASLGQLVAKRILDIVGGLVGCAITFILMIIFGPIIYIKSPGASIFFHQTRIGQNGKKFEMYKFRSMYPDAEERKQSLMEQNRVKDGMMFKLDYDPRIIGCYKDENGTIHKGIGNFIRDTSIDEFPQFWNVLKGDMSMVGTRPPTVDEWEKYEPWHRARMSCKPGITGLWQVSGRSEITDFDEVVRLDLEYIENWDFKMDIKILLKTIVVVFTGRGAM